MLHHVLSIHRISHYHAIEQLITGQLSQMSDESTDLIQMSYSYCSACSYVVGIRNKRTGQLRLSEAAGSILLRLEAQAAHVDDADVAGVIKAQAGQQQQGQQLQDLAARRLQARR
jgi:hypothetical protein